MSHKAISRQLLETINKTYKTLSREEEIEVVKKAQAGDIPSRDALVNSQLRSILVVADSYANHKSSKDDLFMEGIRGVIRAIDTFDLTRNMRFITYSRPWIKCFISHYVGAEDVIRHSTNTNQKIKQQRLSLEPNEEPEVNFRIGMVSLNEPMASGSSRGEATVTLGDMLTNEDEVSPEITVENQDYVKKILGCLNKRQLVIFQLLYGLPQIDPQSGKGWPDPVTGIPQVDSETGEAPQEDHMTLQQVGDRLGLTKQCISIIQINCMKHMRSRYTVQPLSRGAQDSIETEEGDTETFGTVGGAGKITMRFQGSDKAVGA